MLSDSLHNRGLIKLNWKIIIFVIIRCLVVVFLSDVTVCVTMIRSTKFTMVGKKLQIPLTYLSEIAES